MKHQTYERDKIINPTRQDYETVFHEAYENGLEKVSEGKVADYIPALAKADPNAFGISAVTADGETFNYGDVDTRFSIQSISKVINLACSLKFRGFRDTFSYVSMEPTGNPFDSVIKLEFGEKIPSNPMINVGAIEVVSLLAKEFSFEDLLDFAREFCMDEEITLNEEVYLSEKKTGDHNRAIAYLLKNKGVLQASPEDTLDLYFKMCSLNVSARSLAGMGVIIANNGANPFTGKHLLAPGYIRTIETVMFTCGLYDEAGRYGVLIGIPSKSGVGGGLVCAAKGPMGIGLYGPALDERGNSIAAVTAMQHISHRLRLHVFDY